MSELVSNTRAALERWYRGQTNDPSEVIMYAENLITENKELRRELAAANRVIQDDNDRVLGGE